jgi:hypothetical protein
MTTYRGKLSKEQMTFDFRATASYKTYVYVAVWLVTIVHGLLMMLNIKVKPFYLHVMYWSNKVHLIIFNLVFIDFIWYGGHSVLHARGLPIFDQVITLVCLLLTTVDVCLVIRNVASQRDWLYWILLRRKIDNLAIDEKKNMHFEEVRRKRGEKKKNKVAVKEKEKKVIKSHDPNVVKSDDEDEDLKKKKTKNKNRVINYQDTFDEISSNIHLYRIASSNLSPLARVYLNPMARVLYMNHIFRTILYQGVILACQYSSGLAIMILIFAEGYKLTYSTIFYVKYKYLKNIICLLMEVMQSGLLICFLTIAMILHPKAYDEIILDFYQDAGIWIVIASCVAEYLLLLTYIGVAAYDFFKNRKSVNRALKRMNYSFIKYRPNQEPLRSQGTEDQYRPALLENLDNKNATKVLPYAKKGSVLTNSSMVSLVGVKSDPTEKGETGKFHVSTIIGKSANKVEMSEEAKNISLLNQQSQSPKKAESPDAKSTQGSIRIVKPPVTSALKRIQYISKKLNGKTSQPSNLESSPISQVGVQPVNSVSTLVGSPSPVQQTKDPSSIKRPPKMSSLLDLFKKK